MIENFSVLKIIFIGVLLVYLLDYFCKAQLMNVLKRNCPYKFPNDTCTDVCTNVNHRGYCIVI